MAFQALAEYGANEECVFCRSDQTFWIFPEYYTQCEVCGKLHIMTLECDHGLDGMTIDDILRQDDPPEDLYTAIHPSAKEINVDPDEEEVMREVIWENEHAIETNLDDEYSGPPSTDDSEAGDYYRAGARWGNHDDDWERDMIRAQMRNEREEKLAADLEQVGKKMREEVERQEAALAAEGGGGGGVEN